MLFEKIKMLCHKNGLTVRELERRCGFGNGTIRRWGVENQPGIDRVLKVANVFGITIDELLKKEDV